MGWNHQLVILWFDDVWNPATPAGAIIFGRWNALFSAHQANGSEKICWAESPASHQHHCVTWPLKYSPWNILKLTAKAPKSGWLEYYSTSVLLGRIIFRGYVSFRECKSCLYKVVFIISIMVYHHEKNTIWGEFFLAPHRSRVCLCEPTRMGNGWVGPNKSLDLCLCAEENSKVFFFSVAQMRFFSYFSTVDRETDAVQKRCCCFFLSFFFEVLCNFGSTPSQPRGKNGF